MPDDQNPFLAYEWDRIDTSLLVPKQDGETDDAGELDETPQSKRGRRRRS